MEVILGMAGALLTVILFVGGFLCGWTAKGKRTPMPRKQEDLTPQQKQERERLIREQDAFRQQMTYNAEAAYGQRTIRLDGES